MVISSSEFSQLKQKAETLAGEEEKLDALLRKAAEKARRRKQSLKRNWQEITLLIRMVRAYARGQYRKIPWRAIIMAIAALLYFVNPFDIVPDFLTGIGFIDDATVIAFVAKAIREEINRFREYETQVTHS
ncbi:MAG: YkvA family protein [Calditrichia bacterium]